MRRYTPCEWVKTGKGPRFVHEQILAKLEFPQILERLARQCRFDVAAERARELGPSGDVNQVAYLLDVTAEAVDLLTNPERVADMKEQLAIVRDKLGGIGASGRAADAIPLRSRAKVAPS